MRKAVLSNQRSGKRVISYRSSVFSSGFFFFHCFLTPDSRPPTPDCLFNSTNLTNSTDSTDSLPITHYCLLLPLPLVPSLDRGGKKWWSDLPRSGREESGGVSFLGGEGRLELIHSFPPGFLLVMPLNYKCLLSLGTLWIQLLFGWIPAFACLRR